MNAGPFAQLIADFAQNWAAQQPSFAVALAGQEVEAEEGHPLFGELVSLCSGLPASLPYFAKATEVVWCTIAPDSDALRQSVAALHAWVLPSFGGVGSEDGYVQPQAAKGSLAAKIVAASPDGYYRWRCPRTKLPQVIEKLRLQRSLDAIRPARTRPPRPSLYELRARFAAALLIGEREGAEEIIGLLDSLQLETAVNTQFMRIRMWHHFRELDRIRDHPALPHLLAQPLPPRVRAWIDEALGVEPPLKPVPPPAQPEEATAKVPTIPAAPLTWADWFQYVKADDKAAAEIFFQERVGHATPDLPPAIIDALVASLEELFVDDPLRTRERSMVLQGVSELVGEFVREPGFPRAILGNLYLALFRLWSVLHAGISIGQEHGHVLLELASALLQLNLEPDAVRKTIESWWRAKPAPSQLPFALDAIELLERELPGTEATGNLWIEVAGVIMRSPEALPPSDRDLWRRAGRRLGFDDATIAEFLPPEPTTEEGGDPIAAAELRHIAIVCLREEQAHQAADVICERSGAKVSIVSDTAAGAQTAHACQADVVLYVWAASTHAVFRAFDGYDRKRFCYVQGTGSSSIVRSLERWAVEFN